MSSEPSLPTLRIFVSSPSDVTEERAVALACIRRLQGWFQGRLVLVPILWEQEPLLATAGFQQEIDRRAPPSKSDVALFVLWSRLGTPLTDEFVLEDGRIPTGTEWEFEEASAANRERKLPHVLVYRKTRPPTVEVTDPQYARRRADFEGVEAFFQRYFRDATDLAFTGSYHTFVDASGFGQLLETHLAAVLRERLSTHDAGRVTWLGSPFRGLEVFEPEHSRIFFGRTRAIQQVRQALSEQVRQGRAFVLVLGASGNGKSSLVRAGVLPLLTGPWVVEPEVTGGFCRTAVARPGDAATPLEALAAALQQPGALPDLASQGAPADLAAAYAHAPRAAVNDVRGALSRAADTMRRAKCLDAPPPARLVLLVDQVEECFTREGVTDEQRLAFARVIDALARSGIVWVLATLRSDFYSAFSRLEPLLALKDGAGQHDLRVPDPSEIAQIVRLPAQVAGLTYESDPARGRSLDAVLIAEATGASDALPLLQYALTLLEARKEGSRLTFAAYEAMGGLEGAIGQRAEEAWAALGEEARAAFPRVLRALVEVAPGAELRATARRTPRTTLAATPGGAAFVDAFVAARLLVADERGPDRVVSVAHEALLRRWRKAADQISAEAELLRIQTRLRAEAARWDASGRPKRWEYWRGLDLEGGLLLLRSGFELEDRDRAYLNAGETQARRVRALKRLAFASISVLALGAGALYVVAEVRRGEAEQARTDEAVARRASDASRVAATRARTSAEDLLTFMLQDLRRNLEPVGRLDLLQQVASRTTDYYESQEDARSDKASGQRAQAQELLGDVLAAQGGVTEAVVAYRRALEFREAGPGDADRRRRTTTLLLRLGEALHDQGDAEGALEHLHRARSLWTGAAPPRGPTRPPDPDDSEVMARVHDAIGRVLQNRGNGEQALPEFRAAFALRHLVSEGTFATRTDLRRNLARSYHFLGGVAIRQGDATGAVLNLDDALAIREALVADDPTDLEQLDELRETLMFRGIALLGTRRNDAIESFRRCSDAARRLAARDATNLKWRHGLAMALWSLGSTLASPPPKSDGEETWQVREARQNEALSSLREASGISESVSERAPALLRWTWESRRVYDTLFRTLVRMRQGADALAPLERLVRVWEATQTREPGDEGSLSSLADFHSEVATFLEKEGDDTPPIMDAALRSRRRALELAAGMRKNEPDAREAAVALAEEGIARSLAMTRRTPGGDRRTGDDEEKVRLREAATTYATALDRRRALQVAAPGDHGRLRALGWTAEALAEVRRQLGESAAAEAALREAVKSYEQFLGLEPRHVFGTDDLGRATFALAEHFRGVGQPVRSLRLSRGSRRLYDGFRGDQRANQGYVLEKIEDRLLFEAGVHDGRAEYLEEVDARRAALAVRRERLPDPARDSDRVGIERRLKNAELLAGLIAPEEPWDHAWLGKGQLVRRAFERALVTFRTALADSEVSKSTAVLHLGSLSAAGAMGRALGAAREDARQQALAWLREYLRRADPRPAAEADPRPSDEQRAAAQEAWEGQLLDLAKDEGYGELRDSPEFRALIESAAAPR
jgi:tetratricopeptide (TPR) repeat protein